MPTDDSSFPGVFDIEVTFLEGPRNGDVENHKLWFLPGGRTLLLVPPPPCFGAGRWSITGHTLSFDVHEVILDGDGKPATVVQVASPQARLDPDGEGFECAGSAKIYPPGGAAVQTQHFQQRGRRNRGE